MTAKQLQRTLRYLGMDAGNAMGGILVGIWFLPLLVPSASLDAYWPAYVGGGALLGFLFGRLIWRF